jgi:hypothetical protein
MKNLPLIILLVVVVAACKLASKLKSNNNSESSSSSSVQRQDRDEPAEKPIYRRANRCARNGQDISGTSRAFHGACRRTGRREPLTVIPFNTAATARFDRQYFPMAEDFPTGISLKAFQEGAKTRKNGGLMK